MFPEAELDENIFAVKRFPTIVMLFVTLAETTLSVDRPMMFPRTRRFEATVVVPVKDRTLVAMRFPPTVTLAETLADPITWRGEVGLVVPIPIEPIPARFWEL